MAAASSGLSTASVWVSAASPLVAPTNAVSYVLPDGLCDQLAIRLAGPRAFAFWQGLLVIFAAWLFNKHRIERKAWSAAAAAATAARV